MFNYKIGINVFKDFLWFILKENIVVNFLFRNAAPIFFKVKKIDNIETNKIIDKDTVKASINRPNTFINIKGYTSGTTNTPLTVYRSIKSILLEEYIVKSYLNEHGVSLSPRIAVIRGDSLLTADHDGPEFWQLKPFTRRLFFSSYHISEKTAPLYLKQLEKFKPEIIMAYPSSILLLAKFAKQTNWAPSWKLNCVFTSSELFLKENQKTVKSVFGNVLDHYGQAERVAALQLCREGNYHVRQDYSIVEFIQNELGTRIVGSNVHNSAMPLTRYDTNDYVEGVNLTNQCSCGKPTPFVNRILGRDDDYVVLPNGNIIGRLDVAFKGMDSIAECQVEQVTIDELIVRYVPKDGINIAKIEMDLTQRLNERLGITANFEFIPLRNIPRTKAGKFRSVIRSKDIHCV